jgi:glycosyltransferase involved in cell wall biosynthesis
VNVQRILFTIGNLEYSAAAKQLLLLATGLPREQYELQVCNLGRAGPVAELLSSAGVAVESLDWHRKFDLQPLVRLKSLTSRFQPHIVHAWGLAGLCAVVISGIGHSWRLVASPVLRCFGPRDGITPWDRRFLRQCDAVVAAGEGEGTFLGLIGLAADRIRVIPPAVARPRCREPNSQLGALLELHGGTRFILCVGPLESHKHFETPIWTFDIVKCLYEDLHLVIIGDGPDRPRLEQFAYFRHRIPRVHFVGRRTDVPALLREADVVWVPNERGGGVNVALEAMAAERAVVGAQLPGLSEIIVDGETGFLVPPRDKYTWSRRTRLLFDDAKRARTIGEAGKRRAEAHFPVSSLIERYGCLYQSLAGG